MKPLIFHSDKSRSRHRQQLASAENLEKAAFKVDHLPEAMLYC